MLFDKLKDELLEHFNAEVEKLAGKAAIILESELKAVMGEKYFVNAEQSRAVVYEVKKLTWEYLVMVYVNTPEYKIAKLSAGSFGQDRKFSRLQAGRSGQGNRYNKLDLDKITVQKIAGNIYRKGTPGIKFFDITLKQAMPLILAEIKKSNFRICDG